MGVGERNYRNHKAFLFMEIWKNIEGYEGLYQISNLGRVKSLERYLGHNHGGLKLKKELILKNWLSSTGYYIISLSKNNFSKKFFIHRLLCENFIKNPERKREVNHRNGIKTDNTLKNLEWVTSSENTIHSYKTGLQISIKGEKCKLSKLTKEQVLEIRNNYEKLSASKVAKIYNMSKSAIIQIRNRTTWKHI